MSSRRSRLFLYVMTDALSHRGTPLTRPSATLSPLTRGEGQLITGGEFVALLPACGEKVPEGRMRGETDRFNFDRTQACSAEY
jgi:hypothetical protein